MQDRKCEIVINDDYKKLTRAEIREICESINAEYAFIFHNRDINADGTPKTPHWHINIRLKDARDFKTFANYFGVTENNVNKIKSYARSLQYLIHKNAPDKYQYDLSEVTANFDILAINAKLTNKQRKEQIINDIESGNIKMYNLFNHITAIEYNQYKNAINNAFEFLQKKALLTNKQITVIYLWGATGTGKTTYAQNYAIQQGKAYYKSSSSNDPLQDYLGQEVLILDDLRGDSFTFSDFLKVIDPYNNQSSIKSRYHNKVFLGDTIIITSSQPPSALYINKQDCITQLYRRFSLMLEFTPALIKEWVYVPSLRGIALVHTYENSLAFSQKPNRQISAKEFIPELKLKKEYIQNKIFD